MQTFYLGEGYSSLFTYCTQALHLAEGAAYNRIETARAARRFPMVLDGLEDGSLTLTAVRLLSPHLTVENHENVLTSAQHKRKQDIEQIVASLNPKPAVPAVIRKLPMPSQREAKARADLATPAAEPSVTEGPPLPLPREVWRRDGGRCAFVGRDGRCSERSFLEYHHVRPYADGGRHDGKHRAPV